MKWGGRQAFGVAPWLEAQPHRDEQRSRKAVATAPKANLGLHNAKLVFSTKARQNAQDRSERGLFRSREDRSVLPTAMPAPPQRVRCVGGGSWSLGSGLRESEAQ